MTKLGGIGEGQSSRTSVLWRAHNLRFEPSAGDWLKFELIGMVCAATVTVAGYLERLG